MSLTGDLCDRLRFFEKLIENKHMDKNDTCDKSTGNADNGDALRTLSGQDSPGITFGRAMGKTMTRDRIESLILEQSEPIPTPPAAVEETKTRAVGKSWVETPPAESATQSGQEISIGFRSRDEAIERLCQKIFGASPVYPTPPASDLERQLAEAQETIANQRKQLARLNTLQTRNQRERRMKQELERLRVYAVAVAVIRKTLNAADEESAVDAAKRVVADRDEARATIAKAIEQRDALAEALEEMRYSHTDKAERMAVAALAAFYASGLDKARDSADVEFPLS